MASLDDEDTKPTPPRASVKVEASPSRASAKVDTTPYRASTSYESPKPTASARASTKGSVSEVDDILNSLSMEDSKPYSSPSPAPAPSRSIDIDIDLTPDYPAPAPAPAAAVYTPAARASTYAPSYAPSYSSGSSSGSGDRSLSLNALESDLVKEIRRLRTAPIDYANVLNRERRPYYDGTTLKLKRGDVQVHYATREGASACADAIAQLQRTPPMSDVKLAYGMTLAAKDTMGSMSASGSTSLSDSQLVAALARYGSFDGQATQLAGFGHDKAEDIIMNFLISDGDSSRRYRNILLDPKYQFVGVAAGSHNSEFKHMCLLHFVTNKWSDK
eukprot:TRINITY_DN1516_c0_g1_i1.p1 TRINITY_DN1516_c0_g1~~TRINITY_DN1516_c0_g1_i1.p1  ORF type:complete len:383 (-),score=66.61 TRINITY_DN1516_c0_g1_i1:50-1042(-)